MLHYDSKLKSLARKLRKNMTDSEKLLWSKVNRKRLSEYQFYRQRIIGNYIVDFYCPTAKLVIEIDGGQHYYGESQLSDKKRDRVLVGLGLNVIRFSNLDVLKNIEGVLEQIDLELNPPFSKGEIGKVKSLCSARSLLTYYLYYAGKVSLS